LALYKAVGVTYVVSAAVGGASFTLANTAVTQAYTGSTGFFSNQPLYTSAINAADFFPVAAQSGLITTTSGQVASATARSAGTIYTLLTSVNGGRTFSAVPTASLPTGYLVTAQAQVSPIKLAADRSVYGITWDNSMHGWIFGFGYIMSTQNGGSTWVYETPSDVGVTSVTPKVAAIASVPTTY
jgi:hypothetical protein